MHFVHKLGLCLLICPISINGLYCDNFFIRKLLAEHPMQTTYNSYFRIVTFWKKWFFLATQSHPSAGMGVAEKASKKRAQKPYGGVQSPESVRLRGPRSADPQRKNPAP